VRRLRSLFVVTQIACAVVLMIGAALLLKAFVAVGHADVGFTPDAVATGRVRLSPARYREPADRARFFTALAEALSARSDVNAAGAVTQLPMSGAFLGSSFAALAGEDRDADVEFAADLRGVTPDYFRTLGMRVVRGRSLTAADTRDTAGVAVIDETLARRFWPAGDAVGRHLRWVRTNDRIEIVGVVSAVRHYGLAALPRETVYRPYQQYAAIPEMFVEARSPYGVETAQRAIVEEVRRLDAGQPVAELGRVESLVEASLGQPRFNTIVLALFSAIALLLAAIGIYSVMAFAVSERTQEIGVRMALGADPASVRALIVREGAMLTALGVGAGAGVAAIAAGALRSLLVGVSPWDPLVFAGVPLVLAAVAMTASFLPARRAAALDPTTALRTE
jgi:putative ABC transport system permease protein